MKPLKKKSINQLEKYSAVFMQLGLVLTLFIVFVTLEHQTTKQKKISSREFEPDEYLYPKFDNIPVIIIKKTPKEKLKKKPEQPKSFIEDVIPVKNTSIETVIDVKTSEKPDVNFINNLKEEIVPEEIIIEVPFINIEEAPIFKGCENLSKENSKKCFTRQITRFVQKNFNSELAQDLGLKQGKHKIYTQFLIDKTGSIKEIQIRAPHKRLEKEVKILVEKLPKFIPGKQRGKPVKVRYTLPITFQVN